MSNDVELVYGTVAAGPLLSCNRCPISVSTGHKPGCLPLCTLECSDVDLLVGVPYGSSVLQGRMNNNCLIGHRFGGRLAFMQVPYYEAEGFTDFGPDIRDVLISFQLVVECHTEVFGTADFF